MKELHSQPGSPESSLAFLEQLIAERPDMDKLMRSKLPGETAAARLALGAALSEKNSGENEEDEEYNERNVA